MLAGHPRPSRTAGSQRTTARSPISWMVADRRLRHRGHPRPDPRRRARRGRRHGAHPAGEPASRSSSSPGRRADLLYNPSTPLPRDGAGRPGLARRAGAERARAAACVSREVAARPAAAGRVAAAGSSLRASTPRGPAGHGRDWPSWSRRSCWRSCCSPGPAFAVGVRRQRRDSRSSGPPRLGRPTCAASSWGGVVLGGRRRCSGAAVGVGLARLAVPLVERWPDRQGRPVRACPCATCGRRRGRARSPGWRRPGSRDGRPPDRRRRHAGRTPRPGAHLVAIAGARPDPRDGRALALVVLGARGTELGGRRRCGTAHRRPRRRVAVARQAYWHRRPAGCRSPVGSPCGTPPATGGRTAPAVAAVMAPVAGVTALAIGSSSDSAQAQRDYVRRRRRWPRHRAG